MNPAYPHGQCPACGWGLDPHTGCSNELCTTPAAVEIPKPKRVGDRVFELIGGQTLSNVHELRNCEDHFCPIHNPSNHHMVRWPQVFIAGGMKRICPHGNVHPDPDARRVECFNCNCLCCAPDPTEAIEEIKARYVS